MINAIHKRQGQMFEEFLYFNTETIFKFKPLLADDVFKIEIIQSWKYFVEKEWQQYMAVL